MLRLPSLGELDRGMSGRIYLCTSPTDMRKGFDTLAALVKDFIGQDPLSGHLFLFVGRAKDRLKILYWDADGFALWYKRLEEGTFRMPRATSDAAGVELKASELAMMLEGIDLRSIKRTRRMRFDKLTVPSNVEGTLGAPSALLPSRANPNLRSARAPIMRTFCLLRDPDTYVPLNWDLTAGQLPPLTAQSVTDG